jgi:glycerol-3-phosphate O-acyltransferase/dihydroxyacetone phosphate acyltransferase
VRTRRLRGFLDEVGARLARALMRLFFRDVEVLGAERIPRGVPLMILANHVNNLIDPMLIMGFVGGRPRFLAKSTLWSHPIVAPFLLFIGAVPVYRHRDGAPVARNQETFARCREVLAGGGTIALFPEGASHNEPAPLPLKTGAARIVLETLASRGAPGLRVVPVGLVYEDKERFRSRVLVHVGEPIDPGVHRDAYAQAPRAAVRALTTQVAAGLAAVTAPFASWEEARLIDRAVDLAADADPGALAMSERWALWRSFVARYAVMESEDPERAFRLVAALRAYDEERRRLGLREWDLASWPDRGWRAHLRDAREWAAMTPGLLLNWAPFRFNALVSARFTSSPDQPASFKVMGALLFFPLWWALEAALAWAFGGPLAAGAVLVAAPVTGALLLRILDRRRLRPRPVGGAFADRAALRDMRAALRRQIREVAGTRP